MSPDRQNGLAFAAYKDLQDGSQFMTKVSSQNQLPIEKINVFKTKDNLDQASRTSSIQTANFNQRKADGNPYSVLMHQNQSISFNDLNSY